MDVLNQVRISEDKKKNLERRLKVGLSPGCWLKIGFVPIVSIAGFNLFFIVPASSLNGTWPYSMERGLVLSDNML